MPICHRQLCIQLRAAGHDVVHTSQLPAQNRTTDQVINEVSLGEQRIVITKDSDFYHSHLLNGEPWKLLLVRTGNIRARELKELFQKHWPAIETALSQNSLVELDRQTIKVIA